MPTLPILYNCEKLECEHSLLIARGQHGRQRVGGDKSITFKPNVKVNGCGHLFLCMTRKQHSACVSSNTFSDSNGNFPIVIGDAETDPETRWDSIACVVFSFAAY